MRITIAVLSFSLAASAGATSPWRQDAKLSDSPGAAMENLGQVLAISQDGETVVASRVGGNVVDVFIATDGAWSGDVAPAATLDPGSGFPPYVWSLAVSDTGDTIAAGYPFFNGNGQDSGAILVFERPAGGWNGTVPATASLTASDPGSDINLGLAVALAGDTVFAGFPSHRIGSHSGQGAAYVFVKPAAGWKNATQDATLTDSRTTFLSRTLAASEDGSAIVAGSNSGAFAFERPSGGWTNMTAGARLISEHGGTAEFSSVGISNETIVEGSTSEKIGSNVNQGAAYVWVRPSGGWTGDIDSIAELNASDGAANDALGTSVAISGNRVFAGAPAAKVAGNAGQGAAYVFEMPEAGWSDMTQTAKLVASDGASANQFGTTLGAALTGSMLAAGAPAATVNGHAKQGAAYILELPPPSPVVPLPSTSLSRVASRT